MAEPVYLVWAGINVASTYGGPHLHPDVEHLCVAILMLEGVVRFVPTTNWDGLIEVALSRLAPQPDRLLRVVVLPEDFSSPERPAELVKFHGCAVRALTDEEHYRDRLIARESQISGWAAKPDNNLVEAEVARMQDDIQLLRDEASTAAAADVHSFIEELVTTTRLVLSTFRTGDAPAADATHYEPLTVKPAAEALDDPNFPGDALGRFAVAVSLLGRGHLAKEWALSLELAVDTGEAVVRITSESGRVSDVFIVRDAGVLSRLEVSELVDVSSSDVLIICAESVRARATRSPRTRYGRTGDSGAREVDLAALCGAARTADELFESFKLDGVL